VGLPSAREDASEAESESGDAVGERAILARSARAVASVDMGVGDSGASGGSGRASPQRDKLYRRRALPWETQGCLELPHGNNQLIQIYYLFSAWNYVVVVALAAEMRVRTG